MPGDAMCKYHTRTIIDTILQPAPIEGLPPVHVNSGALSKGGNRTTWELSRCRHLDLGYSNPYWAGNHAQQQGRPNLKLNQTVAWWCDRGCRWEDLDVLVGANFLLSKVIVLHIGGGGGAMTFAIHTKDKKPDKE